MNNNFFSSPLQNTGMLIQSLKRPAKILLDKNEQADDVSINLKMKVMDSLMKASWNRYPSSDYTLMEYKTAAYCGLNADNILLSSGSSNIITILLNYFALKQKKIIIAQPTYSLFDYHCNTYNIAYTPWQLTPQLEFDYDHLPMLDDDSVLVITSPNNPVGNCFDLCRLEKLLQCNPKSMIILDNVYKEFSEIDYTKLIKMYDNLIVIRSFSKAFPIAGLRIGYLCAASVIVTELKKLVLPFSLNPLSLVFAETVLFDPIFMSQCMMKVKQIIRQRESLKRSVESIFKFNLISVFPSAGNFLLIKVNDNHIFDQLMKDLDARQIRILNTSFANVHLKNTFRVSIGTAEENQLFLSCLQFSIQRHIDAKGVFKVVNSY